VTTNSLRRPEDKESCFGVYSIHSIIFKPSILISF